MAGASAISIAVIALLVVPSFIDWSRYQDIAKEKLAEATGYELSIGGALRIGLLPSPHASVQDVVLKKPSDPDAFLVFESADVSLALLPLLTGKVEIGSVTLQKPTLTMVTKKDGTDNWKPAPRQSASTDAQAQSEKPANPDTPPVSVGSLNIKEGRVIIRDEKAGTAHTLTIPDMKLKAQNLTGPFNVDAEIGYGNAILNADVTTGGYRAGETLPVQMDISDKAGRARLRWSGVVATGDTPEVQGEMDVSYTDLSGILTDLGYPVSAPILRTKTHITGMLTASADKVLVTNGALDLGGTRMALKVEALGLKEGPKNIMAVIDSRDVVSLDPLVESYGGITAKAAAKSKGEDTKKQPAQKASFELVPASLVLPADMKVDIQLRGKGFEYRNRKTGAFEMRVTANEGKGDLRATIAEIPGGGDISLSGSLTGKGQIGGSGEISIGNLKGVFADWLNLADDSIFENPMVPYRIDTTFGYNIAGRTATLEVKPLSLGETKLDGTIAYTNAARPLLNLKLNGNMLTIASPAAASPGGGKVADGKEAKAENKKQPIEFTPPQLPFDVQFDFSLGRLMQGGMTLTDIKAAGRYDGKGISLKQGKASINGGNLNVSGDVADIKNLAGIDLSAGLVTSDLESFVKSMTGKPLELPKPVGAFSGNAKAKGSKDKLDIDAALKLWGFSVTAAGIVDKPFDAEIPSSVNIRISHPDYVEAVRNFSPGFGSGSKGRKPVDVSGLIKISGKTYEISGLKAQVGGSDFAGNLKADMSGAVPAITANLTSKMLDMGSLVGVESKGAAKTSTGTSGAQAGGSAGNAPWSREPLDTGSMKAANINFSFKAGQLVYGTWLLTDAVADVSLQNGTLKAPISGKLFGGSFKSDLAASSGGKNTPLNIAFDADVANVAVAPFLSALMSSSKKMADGTASVSVALKGSGISSAALVSSLAGKASVKAAKPVIFGMDIDKLAADIVEAFDGGWKGVLAGFATQGFSGGQTEFKDISQDFTITGGEMPVKNFTLETTKSNAVVVSNGTVSFSRWIMDIQSDVKVTQPKDVPVIGVRLSGPLSSPSKSVNSTALDNLVRSKIKDEIGDKIQDKLKDSKAGAIINQFLGGGQQQQPAPTTDTTTPAQPQTQQQPKPQKPVEQQLLEGFINQLGR